jgi:hypothetical protein
MARLGQLSLIIETLRGYLKAIRLVTTSTKLEWHGDQVSTPDVAEIARLTRLRVLSLVPHRRAPDGDDLDRCLTLARLPQLMKLRLGSNLGICSDLLLQITVQSRVLSLLFRGPRNKVTFFGSLRFVFSVIALACAS